MNDLEVAQLVLASSAAADGGCVPCIQGCVDEAVWRHPELPWEAAIHEIESDNRRGYMKEAVESARSWLNVTGNLPRNSEEEPEILIS